MMLPDDMRSIRIKRALIESKVSIGWARDTVTETITSLMAHVVVRRLGYEFDNDKFLEAIKRLREMEENEASE